VHLVVVSTTRVGKGMGAEVIRAERVLLCGGGGGVAAALRTHTLGPRRYNSERCRMLRKEVQIGLR
jgi:hypothetical protein